MASAQRALAPPLEWRAVSSDLRSHVPSVRGTRRAVLILLLLSAVTFFFGLGRQAITDSDEGFYAEAAREMVESGDWLTPHFNYEQRWQKPALYYWLAASTYLITGPTEFAARWWSALSGLGLVLLTWVAARRLTGRDDIAWLAGAIVATSPGAFFMARLALPDLPLAFFITLGIWAAFDNRWLLAGAAAGLGFLMKGPIALVVPAIVLFPVWWRERQLTRLPWRDVGLAAAAFAAIGLPWYGAMTYTHGAAYLDSFFVGDNLERFATDRFNEPRSVFFYVPIVFGGMLPWSMYMGVLPWAWVTEIGGRARRVTAEEWRLLLWAFVPLLFFTLSVGKQPRYILPVLPPLAIMLAIGITRRITSNRRDERALAVATWATALLYAVLAGFLLRAEPLFVTVPQAVTYGAVALIAGAAAVLAWVSATKPWRRLPAVGTGCAVILLLAFQFGTLAGSRPEPVEDMAALVRAHRRGAEVIGTYQVFVRNLVFYTRTRHVDVFDDEHAVELLRSPGRVLLIVRAADLPRIEESAGVTVTRLGEVRYLNTSSIRLRTLLWPAPDQNVERVLLVANKR